MENNTQLNLPKREEEILKFWEENRVFEATLKKTKNGKPFVFFEGPPFANGHPGIHHMEARVLKDVFLRFKTMQGFFVRRKAGWDTHGLPVELQVEKELGLKNKKDIERYGVALFNQKCRENVWKYKAEWDEFTKRIGFWLDLKDPYITYETPYIESLWHIIKRFWETKALYQGYKIIPWCSRCGTGLSSHELGQPGVYRKVKDPSLYVKFPIKGKKNEFLLIWTTTPWTLPGNVAVAVNPKIEYVKASVAPEAEIQKIGTLYQPKEYNFVFLAKTILEKFEKHPSGFYLFPNSNINLRIEGDPILGKDLLGLEYEAPYPQKDIPYKVIAGDFVTIEDGTGMVHIAPAFGEDDMNVAKKEFGAEYPILLTITPEGTMEKGIIGEGKPVKEANKDIGLDLEKRGLLQKLVWYEHEYPFCWRCDTALLYFARESWWVKKPVEKLIANNKKVNWIPAHLRDGRFGEWLREPKDWAFSRERYWGAPMPVWQCASCKHTEVIGSVAELLERAGSSKNTYLLMRHGESEANMIGVIDDSNTHHLTDKGKKEVERAIPKLKKEKIDIIIASDVLRTKETAQKIASAIGVKNIVFDPRIREIHLGVLRGKPTKTYHDMYPTYEQKFAERPEGGENLADLRARMVAFIRDTDEKYSGKKILIVSHEYPIWILWSAGQGMSTEGVIDQKLKIKNADFIRTGEVMAFSFKKLPYSHTGEVDLHRPYIDEVKFPCSKCIPATSLGVHAAMRRVPEVCDVWFDSGSMPFAQDHWPFGNLKAKKMKAPEFFPAEFISEGVDQTRGWFYTLLMVSTLLGFESPYKNVMSLGHVLDKAGQKMSKSRGNVVVPKELIEAYGVDAIRWYFYTINAPDDSKAFDEKDVAGRLRGFLNTFWNSYVLFETYAPRKLSSSKFQVPSSKNILDRWVISRLQDVIGRTTVHLNAYEPVAAARAIEEFLINDVSQWFLRRSRRRFQKPENAKELLEVSQITAYVLMELAKLSAPFVPFFAEIIFQRLRGKVGAKEMSVHLAVWPKESASDKNEKLESEMIRAREMTALALQERAKAGIKIRQPLARFQVPSSKFQAPGLLDIVKDEINIKEIIFGDEFKLDTTITPELREEGFVRELMRNIQEMRKDGGMKPGDVIFAHIETSQKTKGVVEKWREYIKKEVGAKEISFGGKSPAAGALGGAAHFTVEKEMKEDGETIWIGIRT